MPKFPSLRINRVLALGRNRREESRDEDGFRILRSSQRKYFGHTHSSRRLNRFSRLFPEPPRYLEIGLQHGYTFEKVRASTKVGIEPEPRFSLKKLPKNVEIFVGTSNEYFSRSSSKFDIVFVDGLHTAEQAYEDLINSLRCLKRGGVVLLDDVWPIDEWSALPSLHASEEKKREQGIVHPFWYGDVYKVLGLIRKFHPELEVSLVRGEPNHIQAVVYPASSSLVVQHPNAGEFIAKCKYEDFFSHSGIASTIPIVTERQAARLWKKSRFRTSKGKF